MGQGPGWERRGVVVGCEAVEDILGGRGFDALGGEEEEAVRVLVGFYRV